MTPNIIAKNGIIHQVDTILLSAEPPIDNPGTLIEELTKKGNFKKLIKAITDSTLTEELNKADEKTIFAPNDAAFDKLTDFENKTEAEKKAIISR